MEIENLIEERVNGRREGNSLLCQIFLHHVVNRVYVTNICKLDLCCTIFFYHNIILYHHNYFCCKANNMCQNFYEPTDNSFIYPT